MYQIGDLIMYGARGACRVKEITELDWSSADNGREYYVLEPLYKDDVIYVPVDNTKVFMRPIMSEQEVLDNAALASENSCALVKEFVKRINP